MKSSFLPFEKAIISPNNEATFAEAVDEHIRQNIIKLKWRNFYRIPETDERYLNMTFSEMALDVLAMDKLSDPKSLYEVLTGGVVINKSEVKQATEQETKEIVEQFQDLSDQIKEMDAALDSLLGPS